MKPSFVIIGLGNPDVSYKQTRHNAGFLAVDILAKRFGNNKWQKKAIFEAEICEGRVDATDVFFVKPRTYMNLSGKSVKKMVDFYKMNTNHILVIVDDVDIPLGKIRLRRKGSGGTHNGLKSIVGILGEEFPRLRIGIGPNPPDKDLSVWVLSRFSENEEKILNLVFEDIAKMIKDIIIGE